MKYDNREYTLKYARKLKPESTGGISRTCSGKLFVKTDSSIAKTTQVSTLCSNNMATYRVSTCTLPPSTRVARSRIVRSSPSLTTRVAA